MKTKTNTFNLSTKSICQIVVALAIGVIPVTSSLTVSAAQITSRSITLSTSAGDASGVSYSLATSALPTTGTSIKSLEIKFCTAASGACVTPAGFSTTSSTLSSQPSGLGSTSGWTINTATAGSLRISNGANSTNPSGAVSAVFGSVHNPTAVNATYYGIVTTYSDASWSTAIDTGTIALSTTNQIQVGLTVSETITFCTGTSITGQNCATAAGNTVNLGTGSTTATATGTSILAASTNGSTGYSITVNGNTLSSGANTITSMASGGVSSVGSKQFGLNLAGSNTAPTVGAAVSGSGTGVAATNYGTNNNFRFNSGDVIATASGATNANTFTVGYIANIDGITPAGSYNTVLTYTATANF